MQSKKKVSFSLYDFEGFIILAKFADIIFVKFLVLEMTSKVFFSLYNFEGFIKAVLAKFVAIFSSNS